MLIVFALIIRPSGSVIISSALPEGIPRIAYAARLALRQANSVAPAGGGDGVAESRFQKLNFPLQTNSVFCCDLKVHKSVSG